MAIIRHVVCVAFFITASVFALDNVDVVQVKISSETPTEEVVQEVIESAVLRVLAVPSASQAACSDARTFVDEQGYSCSDWNGYDCTRAVEDNGYTQAGENGVLVNCEKTCGTCQASTCGGAQHHGTLEGAPCQFPFAYAGQLHNDCISTHHTEPWCLTDPVDMQARYQRESTASWGNCNCQTPNFDITTSGQSSCNSGYTPITSATDCKAGTVSRGLYYQGSGSWSHLQSGCIKYSNRVWFNTDGDGQDENIALICKASTPTPPTPAPPAPACPYSLLDCPPGGNYPPCGSHLLPVVGRRRNPRTGGISNREVDCGGYYGRAGCTNKYFKTSDVFNWEGYEGCGGYASCVLFNNGYNDFCSEFGLSTAKTCCTPQ